MSTGSLQDIHCRTSLTPWCVECTCYGAYTVLFGLATWVLPRKFNVPAVKIFFFPAIIALFLFATLSIAFNLMVEMNNILALSGVDKRPRLITAAVYIGEVTFALSDILGDMILFYRVYAVWRFRKKTLLPLLVILFVAKGAHSQNTLLFFVLFNHFHPPPPLVFEIIVVVASIHIYLPIKLAFSSRILTLYRVFVYIFSFVNAFANLLMTVMIAGRVWWISRQCGLKLRWYHRVVAAVAESGVIYPLFLIIMGSINVTSLKAPKPTTLGVIAMGLGPTLIAVRVGSGSAYDDESLRAGQTSEIVLSTVLESQRPISEFRDTSDIGTYQKITRHA
ncbi:hypothetical protein D9757_008632 [Collybiopsis confluens]|uniref:Uncharacterized protein n=1 Tax=Collybiopsis confluens TaxID=2823264 RepID=A0A8H5M0J4_9AGAR|nr:hypothetical protein D9757_008632 [Collybiopsis confluens]